MRQRKRSYTLLFMGIISFLVLFYIILFLSPTYEVQSSNFTFPIMYLFFLSFFLFVFSLITFIFKSKTHGLLIGLFFVSFLIFHLNDLAHPFFFILLAALFLTLELFFTYRK